MQDDESSQRSDEFSSQPGPSSASSSISSVKRTIEEVTIEDEPGPSIRVQKKITGYMRNFTPELTKKFKLQLTKSFVVSGIPFRFVESEAFVEAMKVAGIESILPNRKAMATQHLKEIYQKAKDELDTCIQQSNAITLLVDGWKNPNGLHVLNVAAATPLPYLIETKVFIGSCNSEAIKDILFSHITKIGEKKVVAISTDNASDMIHAVELTRAKVKHILPVRCQAHVLNLLTHDILNYPCLDLCKSSTLIASEFIKIPLKRGILKRRRAEYIEERREIHGEELNIGEIRNASQTRWYSYYQLFESLLANRVVLTRMANETHHLNNVKDIINNSDYWKITKVAMSILKPIVGAIGEIESDKKNIAIVWPTNLKLKKEILTAAGENEALNQAIQVDLNRRLGEKYCTLAHMAASFLHPRLKNLAIEKLNITSVVNFIASYSRRLNPGTYIEAANSCNSYMENKDGFDQINSDPTVLQKKQWTTGWLFGC